MTGPDGAEAGTAGSAVEQDPAANPRSISRMRLVSVDVLVGLATVLLVVGMFSVFANRLLLNPTNWSKTSTQLLQSDNIRSTTANYVVDQFYANVNVAAVLKSELPPALQPLAAPAAGALRNAAVQVVDTALTRPRVQALWRQANYAADQTFVAVVKGGKGPVVVNQGVVTLNLGSIVDNVANRLGLPSNLGAKLPANVANLTVLKSNQLKLVQDVGNAIQGLALWLTILAPVLYALAVVVAAGHRRRTLMTVGFAAVFAGVLVFLGRSLLVSQIPGALTNSASLQTTIADVVSISTGLLSEVAGAVTLVGGVFVLCAWFAGPARPFVATRRAMAPFLREHAAATYAVTLGVMALVFIWDPIPATGKPAGIIVFTLLALLGTEALRRETAREFPEARPGETTRVLRAGLSGVRRRPGSAPQEPTPTPAQELQRLTELRDRGAISDDEYESAKRQILHR